MALSLINAKALLTIKGIRRPAIMREYLTISDKNFNNFLNHNTIYTQVLK